MCVCFYVTMTTRVSSVFVPACLALVWTDLCSLMLRLFQFQHLVLRLFS